MSDEFANNVAQRFPNTLTRESIEKVLEYCRTQVGFSLEEPRRGEKG